MANRLGRLICGVGVAVLSLAGCVSMPDSGPPTSLPANQSATGQNQDYGGLFPAGPGLNWTPQQIVQGFLFASASYYTAGGVVREYMMPDTARSWDPHGSVTVSSTWDVSSPALSSSRTGQQATVTVSGEVRAQLNGSGQPYASAVGQGGASSTASGKPCPQVSDQGSTCYSFTLVKSAGQWRISQAPRYLLLDEQDFDRTWKPQDLYFFDSARKVLVPDSVFVPIGTSETELLNKLAAGLQKGPPPWLSSANATVNIFPAHIAVTVIPDGPVAIVNLRGKLTSADLKSLPAVSAELVWTLTSATVNQSNIQSVQLEVNGSSVFAPGSQNRAKYQGYDPYPSRAASFTYVDQGGTAQSKCGSTQDVTISSSVPVFGNSEGGEIAACGITVPSAPSTTPSGSSSASKQPSTGKQQPSGKSGNKNTTARYAMVAVSPDGSYVATVAAGGGSLSITPLDGHGPAKSYFGPNAGITSISWDRHDDLWLAQPSGVWMVSTANGVADPMPLGGVTALSVAPDGVRVAAIVQGASGNELELFAINASTGDSGGKAPPHGGEPTSPVISTVPLGPGITNAVALTWYDVDNLLVVNQLGVTSQLEEVPVDGRVGQPVTTPQMKPDETMKWIAAGNTLNILVAGMSDGQLEVSDGINNPWQNVGSGAAPSYQILPAS